MKRACRLLSFFVICLTAAVLFVFFYAPTYTGLVKPERFFYAPGIRCSCGYALFEMIDRDQYYEVCPGHLDLKWRGYLQKEGEKTYVMLPARGKVIRIYTFDPVTHKLEMLDIKNSHKGPYPIPMVFSPWQVLADGYYVDALNFVFRW